MRYLYHQPRTSLFTAMGDHLNGTIRGGRGRKGIITSDRAERKRRVEKNKIDRGWKGEMLSSCIEGKKKTEARALNFRRRKEKAVDGSHASSSKDGIGVIRKRTEACSTVFRWKKKGDI